MGVKRVQRVVRGVAVGVVALWLAGGSLASAGPLSYDWIGSNGFTGYFTLDGSAFSSTSIFSPIFGGSTEYQAIPESYLSALYMTNGNITFNFSDVNPASVIWFNSAVSPPTYADGGGYAATDAAGDQLSFNASNIYIWPAGGDSPVGSDGNFVSAPETPEPSALLLAVTGMVVLALAALRKRGNRFPSP
jgi:hypothetical protein